MVSKANYGFIFIAVGLLCAILGMTSVTGILKLGIPVFVMYLGFFVTVMGLFMLYTDLKENQDLLEEYEAQKESQDADTKRNSAGRGKRNQ